MDQNEYISTIGNLTEYCNCKDVSKLLSLIKKRDNLSKKCLSLLDSLSGSEVKKIYDQKTDDLIQCRREYRQELISLVERKKLKLFLS